MGLLVLVGINTCLLPNRFGKGLLVSLLSHFLAAILASVIVLIVLTFEPSLGQIRHQHQGWQLE